MTKFKILSAAAILSLTFVTPVFAQAAIQEPGSFAFYYPNNDILNGGRPTPAARMDAEAGLGPFSGSYAYAAPEGSANGGSCAQRYHSYDPSSETFLGYDGRRHACK
ncbi:BA14K family protein [Bradyrhizobium canariense]|uniref:Lectin-like protein BA14k n=1 Tax=Bradyrhizobium canariense TaxID=255045 RepID=A0A1H2AWP9_9BRAD|nr:BA14K family protein [Bradyrhizobium canariense]SDT50344.1 BA14K-like protein [Bradyrhizobium canariense]